MLTAVEEVESALRAAMDGGVECDHCESDVVSGEVVAIGSMIYHLDCGVLVAAAIASSVLTGGEEIAKEVAQSAEILEMAVRILRSRLGGRAA